MMDVRVANVSQNRPFLTCYQSRRMAWYLEEPEDAWESYPMSLTELLSCADYYYYYYS